MSNVDDNKPTDNTTDEPFTDDSLRKIMADARERGDEEAARLAHSLIWAQDCCDQNHDSLVAFAREIRRVFPILQITVDGDGSLVETVTKPLREMLAQVLDAKKPGEATMRFTNGGFDVTPSHWAIRTLIESLAKSVGPAPNFVTMTLVCPDGEYRVTVEKPNAKSLAEIIFGLKDEIKRLEGVIATAKSTPEES